MWQNVSSISWTNNEHSFPFSNRAILHYCNYQRGKASSGLVESFKALNQSALMDDLDSSMHIWISLAGAPVPVLSTADQVTGYTLTWLTQLPVIDNMPACYSLLPSQYWCCVWNYWEGILKYFGYLCKLRVKEFFLIYDKHQIKLSLYKKIQYKAQITSIF